MKKSFKKVVFAAAVLSSTLAVHALPPPVTDMTQNRGYIGLVWTVGQSSAVPDLGVGRRYTKTDSASDVKGHDVSARFKLNGGMAFDSARALYLNGNRSSQANVGLGYSATYQSLFGTVGASAEHLKLGLDYLYKPAKFDPFVEINTLKKPAVTEQLPN